MTQSQKTGLAAKRVSVQQVGIDCLSMSESLRVIEEMIQSGQPHLVATANSTGIVMAAEDPDLLRIYQQADLITADSIGVIWALKRRGIRQERVTGVDMVDQICALSADRGYSIFLLGAEPGVADLAAEKLRLKYAGVNIIGTRHGYFPASDNRIVAEEIAPHKPDILIVAMGIPRQEKFISETRDIHRTPVSIGVGGTLDVFSGRAKRAPRFIQSLHLEWLWRILSHPSKFVKAKHLPVFAWRELRSNPKP